MTASFHSGCMPRFVAVSGWVAILALAGREARGGEPAAVPDDLAGVVAIALERHPERAAFQLEADAAHALSVAAGRPMDAQWMLGAQALGALPDSPDPTMFMVGVEQMISLPSAYRAPRERAALDVRWAEGEGARVEADVRESLWATAARLRAQAALADALDEQIRAAEAALAFGRARYSTGAGTSVSSSPSGDAEPETVALPPPIVAPRTRAGSGMSGMGGGAKGGGPPGSVGMKGMGDAGATSEMGGMTGGMSTPMGGEGLAALLRLDAEVARVRADRDALAARRAGEEARLTLIVGDEAARVVAANPARFLGAAGGPAVPPAESGMGQPERLLAATAIEMAEADEKVARAGRLPRFMVATDVRVMPEGMVDGVDAKIGVILPLWGGTKARVQAATSAAAAASKRSELVDRGLADAIAAASADEAGAEARAKALAEVAVPRARAAWDATVAVWGAGRGTAADLVAAWQTSVAVTRDAAEAALAVELARARLARLEGR